MMKYINKIILLLSLVLLFASCGESFLDTENVMEKSTENFPKTEQDAQQALTGVYSGLAKTAGGIDRQSLFMVSELMSDDRLGGGGTDDRYAQAVDRFLVTNNDMFSGAWAAYYKAIYRANSLLETIDLVPWTENNMAVKNKILGETYFLRAYFYFDLVRMFGSVPLLTSTEKVNKPKTAANEIYAQIAEDLQRAINMLPEQSFQEMPESDLGRATKWTAQALVAKVFLFYTGYYKTDALPTNGDKISKQQVIQWIDECISRSGHGLITSDFRNLWPYSYCSEGGFYSKYPVSQGLKWIRETGDNIETVFAVKYSIYGGWSGAEHYSNIMIQFFGLRNAANWKTCLPFAIGWGWGNVNPKLMAEWPNDDPRKEASVVDCAREINGFVWNVAQNMDETGYIQKKYIPLNVLDKDGNICPYSMELYGMAQKDRQLQHTQDMVIIRFADVLLMAAELGSSKAQEYMDRVRGRVGLASVPATLENIKKERRYELAFEGVRYYDILRWHDQDVLTANQTDIPVKDVGVDYKRNIVFRTETGGFLQIPQTQIDLSEGVLTQNPGWESGQHLY
ncbi:RagB/SusD family nutrient uptake outer membrane protein [Dysgonomonas termitidis]|uniref:RagB/SusD family nutrient uptake outer membrane protein n=1 Tax=Dysgonomonas termitidis TaxID=1516126 RepID=A0ABV9L0N2_9BACT